MNVNIGHQHPAVVQAIQEQADAARHDRARRPRTSRAARPRSASSAHAPDGFRKVFFTNGGADANENAIRMARLHTGRDKVLSTYRSYHGNTGAAIVATGDWRRMPNQYARGHVHFFGPYLYRSEFWATTPEEESRARAAPPRARHPVRGAGDDRRDPARDRCRAPPASCCRRPATSPACARSCDRYGIMLILDEVMAGFGRTGRWFAFEGYDVVPDLITFAKGVNSGYVPVGRRDHLRPDRGDVRRPRLPRRAHLLAGIRSRWHRSSRRSTRWSRRASSRTPGAIGADAIGPGARRARRAARRHRRGARRGRVLGGRARRRPRDPRAAAGGRRWAAQDRARRARAPAVRAGQPHPRRAAVRRHRRRGRRRRWRSTTKYSSTALEGD